MLDAAKRIGFDVTVNDEGGYWEKRDVHGLVKAILGSVKPDYRRISDAVGTSSALFTTARQNLLHFPS
jgi:hypothetical protein